MTVRIPRAKVYRKKLVFFVNPGMRQRGRGRGRGKGSVPAAKHCAEEGVEHGKDELEGA